MPKHAGADGGVPDQVGDAVQVGKQSKAVVRQRLDDARGHHPARCREQPSAQTEVLEHPVGGHQPQVGLVRAKDGEFAAPLLGGRVVVAVQHEGVAAGPPGGQPFDRARVAVEPVVTTQPGSHQQRHRHVAGIHLRAERLDVGQGAFAYPRDRDDQFSSHTRSLTIPGVGMVKDTQTAGVYPAPARMQARRPREGPMPEPVDRAPVDANQIARGQQTPAGVGAAIGSIC